MKVNQLVTKIIIRAFFILLVAALVPFLQGDQSKLQHIYLSFHHWWQLIFPVLLIASFITLLITCMVKKYKEQELNWLLVLNTFVLMIYIVAIFIRVWKMV